MCASGVNKHGPINKFLVLKLECPYCGENKYLVVFCDACGTNLKYVETLELTLPQLREFMKTQNVQFIGPPDVISQYVKDEYSDLVPDEVTSLTPEELDSLDNDIISF